MMLIDVRFPMGLLFAGLGLILLCAGIIDPDPVTSLQRKVGTNMNLYWGCFMIVFGLLNLVLAWRKSRLPSATQQQVESVSLRL
jgi:hypothetical protein